MSESRGEPYWTWGMEEELAHTAHPWAWHIYRIRMLTWTIFTMQWPAITYAAIIGRH